MTLGIGVIVKAALVGGIGTERINYGIEILGRFFVIPFVIIAYAHIGLEARIQVVGLIQLLEYE